MSIRRRINRFLSIFLTSVMVLLCLGNATPAFAADVASGGAIGGGESGPTLENPNEPLYTQDFEGVTDASTVAISPNAQSCLTMVTGDATYGTYLSYSTGTNNSRGANMGFDVDVTALDSYVVEFDAALTAGNGQTSNFTVKGADFADNGGVNNGAKSGYLLNLVAGGDTTEWTVNGIATTIPKGEWCHYTLLVDKTQGLVSTTIVGSATGTILDGSVTAYNGEGNVAGIYMLAGRYYPVQLIDNIVIRNAADDEVIEAVKEYTVSFDLQGHGEAIEAVKVKEGTAVAEPTAPVADGYFFIGWYTDAACTTAYNFATPVSADTTIYARWEAVVVEDVDALYWQSFANVWSVGNVAISDNAQDKLVIKSDDTHGNYLAFDTGSANSRGAYMNFADMKDVIALDTYFVEFDAAIKPGDKDATQFAVKGADFAYSSGINGGAGSGYLLKLVNAGASGTVYTVNDVAETTVTIPSGEWCHYELAVDKTAGTVIVTITGDTTGVIVENLSVTYNGEGNVAGLYLLNGRYNSVQSVDNIAVLEKKAEEVVNVKVTFDMNGNGTAIDPVEVAVGTAVTEPTAPTAEGYTFGGWYTDKDCTTAYDFATLVSADITLYAKWTENSTQGPTGGSTVDTATWTFGDAYLVVKGFDTASLEETAIGETGFKVATTTTKSNYNNVVVRDENSANEGYYPRVAPAANGYYLFVGAGGNGGTTTATLTLPGTVPAGKEIKINFVKIEGTNNGKVRDSSTSENNIVVGDTTIDLMTSYDFTTWNTATVTATSDISSITINLGSWAAVGIAKIEVADPVGDDPSVGPTTPTDALYAQDFTDVTDVKSLASSANAGDALGILTDDVHGNYFSYDVTALNPGGGRGALMNFNDLDVSDKNVYIVEFDAAIKAANNKASEFVVRGSDFADDGGTNNGAKSGFLLKLENAGANSTEYTVNDGDNKLTIPSGEWCHYKLYVDKTMGKVSVTITGTETIADKLIVSADGAGNVAGLYFLAGRYNGAFSVDNIIVRELTDDDEVEIKSGEELNLVVDATGDTTAVDTSSLIFNDKVTGYRVTTSKNGVLVSQTVVTNAPTSVDTTGADKVEITPVFFFDIGVAGEKGTAGYDIAFPAGSYDFVVYNTSGKRCDVYANDQMLVNNILQYGSTPNYFAVKDIVIKEDNIRISTTDYSSSDSANNMYIQVQVTLSSTIVDRAQKVFVLGDSLVAMYYNGGSADSNVQTGWGQVLADYMVDSVDVVDLGNSGVTANGLYGSAFSQVIGSGKSGDILVLESGYNDKSYDTEAIMKTAVTNMVTEAEALGIKVILVSPNASAHDYKASVAWTGYMADVATATGADYIDLSKLSYEFLFDLYGSDTTVLKADWNVSDTLHSTYNGANKWASIIAAGLYELGYTDIVDTDYIYAFSDSVGNVISCNAVGKMAAGYYKVTFDMNGQGAANTYQVVKEGGLVTKPASPAATGFVFDGWYKDAEGTTKWDFAVDTISADTTIYAKWVANAAGTLYTQNFSDVTDASTVATSTNAQDQLVIKNDETLGNYLAYDFSNTSTNSRGAYMNFAGLDVSGEEKYVVEFDAVLTPGNNQTTYFTVKGTDFGYISNNINYGAGSGFLLNLVNAGGGSTTYTMNTTQTVTIPSGEWCHYTIYVDKTQGLVSTTIVGVSTGTVADKVVTAYDGAGDVAGFYMLAGRYYPYIAMDNILVREVGEYDVFGEVVAETLASAEFTTGLNTVINQPEEGKAVHLPITVKGNGSLNGDLTDKVTVKWSVVGLDKEDGYISLTKAEGTGAGTDGEAPDGTTAYFNVRNGVSNYFGYVQAVVTYGEDSYTITTPFAVIGATGSDANQLAPAVGYPVNMDDYSDELLGYAGTSNAINSKDLILNNWSIYGSNGKRTMKLVEVDGKKAIEFASNGGSGSTVAVYQWVDQSSQYVIDFTAKFSADMAFGVYGNTPNNGTNNPEWTATFASGALTLGTETVSGLNANEWYRIVVTADPSVQKVGVEVYNNAGELMGEIADVDMSNDTVTQKYFCFQGTWPMYLNSFKAYLPALESITVGASADVVKVPEAGEAAATVDFSAILTSNSGVQMTGEVAWSLAEEYANVELLATGAQTATLTISEGASGTVTVIATKDGKQGEITIQLTTSSNVVAFKQSTSSITIPFTGEDAFVGNFVAVTRDGNGNEIDGGAITYTLLAKDGVTETTVKGVTFKDGVLTVAAGAAPAVVYVKAANAEGLSTKVKVNIHGLSFAFGSAEAAEGFTQVADTLYTAKLGYGFANTSGLTVNEGNVTGTSDFRFKATVPNGNYTVKLVTSAESVTSEVVESVSAVTGIAKSGATFSVAVCDGVLDLTFPANATVTSIEISQAAPKTALEKPMVYAIGDSTTKNNASGALSWGNCVSDGKVVVPDVFSGFANHGMAGRDSVNYYNQGRVEAVLLAICPGDYVTVNMGINSKESGEAGAFYTLLSEYYVEGIIQRGGIPVIVTATPDGPVGDRVAGNYDSTTGKFTNSRGNGARNDVLRQIANEKGLTIIELGQWGQDWMNTLTAADVTAYNAANGTAYTTVLEMVQSWYVDHNHYKEYLGIKIGEYLLGELKDLTVDKESVVWDFENESSPNWDMTGDLSGSVTIVEASGNKYLQLQKNEARTTTTIRRFENMPKMTEATVEFDWYTGGQTSTSRMGFTGFKLMAGDVDLITLYTGEMRAAGDTTSVYYTTGGFDAKVESAVKVTGGAWNTVSADFDFVNDTVTVAVNGAAIVTTAIDPVVQKVDGFGFLTVDPNGGTKVTLTAGIDNLTISYVEKTAEDETVTIYSLGVIENVPVTLNEWIVGYEHPTTVSALLSNGETIEVEIDVNTWTCENFDKNVKGAYTWIADIIAPEQYANTKGLKATYVMEYAGKTSAKHDYYNDFTFASDIIPSVAWGKGMDSTSGSGGFGLSLGTDTAGNGYLHASVTGNGDRGSRLDLDGGIVKGATFTFDWMPINSNGSGNGQLLFVSNSVWHSYFGLRFDKDYNITAFTKNPLGMCSTIQEAYEGEITADNPIVTGLSGQNKWFTVSVTFDYLAHTADLTITDKAAPENTFTLNDIPIDPKANGTRALTIHMNKLASGASVAMGLDNIAIDYVTFGAEDVTKVTNPPTVSVSKLKFNEFTFPSVVNVIMGDGTTKEMPVKNWTAEPEFDPEVAGTYFWTAELILGKYTNYFGLYPSFTMTYTMLPYPTFVYNPSTVELEYGDKLPSDFPTSVVAHMSDGSITRVEVGEWTAIKEFNDNEEGIYVYGANVVAKEGKYDVVPEMLSPNENPEDPSAQRADYVYDVYYRISYFKDEDNYNGYTRTMEYLDRGVYAVDTENGVFVSWRLLATEYGEDVAFNVYRNGSLVNSSPIDDKTNIIDKGGNAGDVYTVVKLQDGKLYESEETVALKENYITIPTQKPEGLTDKDGNECTYTMNDANTADVDGDGQYEIVIKWIPDDAFDSGNAGGPSGPTLFDVYEMDGTPLWRLNLGLELPSGAHFNQFVVYDMDEDGKAELFIKTSDGSVTYKPNANGIFDMNDESTIVSYIGNKAVTPGSSIGTNGHVSENVKNEYVTVFNGMTGKEIDTVKYVNETGAYADWGKEDGGNRSARYNIGIAYIPEVKGDDSCTDTIPAVVFNRGYYDKTTVAAYTLRDGKLNLDWNFYVESGKELSGKGNHNLATGDIDKDGFDEVILGAIAIDHDGSVLWVKNGKDGQDKGGHADSIHLAAMNPNSNDLYVFTPAEDQSSTLNYSLVNARTGTRHIGEWFTAKDVGRGVAANITPLPGYESWAAASGSGLYAFDGSLISTSKNVPMNWVLYWDGDLLSELGDGSGTEGNAVISKYNWDTDKCDVLEQFADTKMCNWSKNTPSLTADLFGDWREEVVVRNTDDTELRIYMTTIETDYMIYTLMHDPVYRNSVAAQNSAYNQPSHVGIYLGEDQRDVVLNMQLDKADIVYAVAAEKEEIKNTITDSTADNIIENVGSIGADKVADAMQNDQEVLDKVAEIEDTYVENTGVEVLAPEVAHPAIKTDDIKATVGVGLNAEEGNSTIGLKFEETPREDKKPVDKKYGASVQVDITLEVDGEAVEGKLDMPITIRMKLPKGLSTVGLWIMHYHGDDMKMIKPAINSDGTISFSVTDFSTFVFANTAAVEDTDDDDDTYYDDNEENRDYAEDSWKGQTGWQKVNGKWYYFDANGNVVIGWVQVNGKWYYMNKDGSMATGWVQAESGLWYYMDLTNGDMLSNGWLCDPASNLWYYLDENGAMCTNWIFVDGAWYLLDMNGSMCTGWNIVDGKWYYMGTSGAMLTGWQEVGGKFYYMVETGECLINTTTPDGRKVDENGARVD